MTKRRLIWVGFFLAAIGIALSWQHSAKLIISATGPKFAQQFLSNRSLDTIVKIYGAPQDIQCKPQSHVFTWYGAVLWYQLVVEADEHQRVLGVLVYD